MFPRLHSSSDYQNVSRQAEQDNSRHCIVNMRRECHTNSFIAESDRNYSTCSGFGNQFFPRAESIWSRHYPHYLLMNLYRETNRDSLALKEAAYLLEQPPKVQSQAIEDMKLEAASYIHYLDSYCDD